MGQHRPNHAFIERVKPAATAKEAHAALQATLDILKLEIDEKLSGHGAVARITKPCDGLIVGARQADLQEPQSPTEGEEAADCSAGGRRQPALGRAPAFRLGRRQISSRHEPV